MVIVMAVPSSTSGRCSQEKYIRDPAAAKLATMPIRGGCRGSAFTTTGWQLARYAHRFSPHTYTQPQLFACLVLKVFLKTDYRGLTCSIPSVAGGNEKTALLAPPLAALKKGPFDLPQFPERKALSTGEIELSDLISRKLNSFSALGPPNTGNLPGSLHFSTAPSHGQEIDLLSELKRGGRAKHFRGLTASDFRTYP
ncbi:MAG TPA: hypothetical protein VG099_21010 [Gemmataceae bacterium]|jgi:hypothetical protein|nr:hypothetical protein [Gemmataceae bacterium]